MAHERFMMEGIYCFPQSRRGKKLAVGIGAEIAVFIKNEADVGHPDFSEKVVIHFSGDGHFIDLFFHAVLFVLVFKFGRPILKFGVKNNRVEPLFSCERPKAADKIPHLFSEALA